MNNPLTSIKELASSTPIKNRLQEILGKNAESFTSTLIQMVNQSDMLKKADANSVMSAAMMAATLKLPINNNLGFAYIVPFKNSKKRVTEAQFQIGYKGFIQLAMRTGEFKHISITEVYEGQLIENNPLTGCIFDWSIQQKENETPVGFAAYFKLLSGFEATNYMSYQQVNNHAKKYSQSFINGYGPWKDNFNSMAMKTVLKQLLSKFAPMSIEVAKGIESDQAVINGDNKNYSDNIIDVDIQTIDEKKVSEIRDLLKISGSKENGLLGFVGATSINEMTEEQYQKAKDSLNKKLEEKAIPNGEEVAI